MRFLNYISPNPCNVMTEDDNCESQVKLPSRVAKSGHRTEPPSVTLKTRGAGR